MSEQPFTPFDMTAECLSRLEACSRKFRDRPPQKFLEEVAGEFAKRLKLAEVEKYLDGIEKRHHRFPPMMVIDSEIKKIERPYVVRSPGQPPVSKRWRSTHAPGTPAIAELVFELIRDGRTGERAFARARVMLSQLDDEELWQCYEAWTRRQVHSLLIKDEEGSSDGCFT